MHTLLSIVAIGLITIVAAFANKDFKLLTEEEKEQIKNDSSNW